MNHSPGAYFIASAVLGFALMGFIWLVIALASRAEVC